MIVCHWSKSRNLSTGIISFSYRAQCTWSSKNPGTPHTGKSFAHMPKLIYWIFRDMSLTWKWQQKRLNLVGGDQLYKSMAIYSIYKQKFLLHSNPAGQQITALRQPTEAIQTVLQWVKITTFWHTVIQIQNSKPVTGCQELESSDKHVWNSKTIGLSISRRAL